MKHIDFYTQVLPLLLSMIGVFGLIIFRQKTKKNYNKTVWLSTLLFLSLYFSIVLASTCLDVHYLTNYESYDINKNGFIEKFERNTKQQLALERVTKDTARNLAFITAMIFSSVIMVILFLSKKLIQTLSR